MGMTIKRYAVAAVGGGVAMTAGLRGLLYENAARGDPLRDIEIAVVEPRDRLGVGTAWDTRDPLKLSNMAAATLRVYGALDPGLGGFDILGASDLFEGRRADGRPL